MAFRSKINICLDQIAYSFNEPIQILPIFRQLSIGMTHVAKASSTSLDGVMSLSRLRRETLNVLSAGAESPLSTRSALIRLTKRVLSTTRMSQQRVWWREEFIEEWGVNFKEICVCGGNSPTPPPDPLQPWSTKIWHPISRADLMLVIAFADMALIR